MTSQSGTESAASGIPAGRSAADEILHGAELIRRVPLLQTMMDAVPHIVVIVNRKRQIVAANEATRTLLCAESKDLLGKRPGEAINCIHAAEGSDGCGSSRYCPVCQAVQAVLQALEWGGPVRRDARLSLEAPEGARAVELRVTATPIEIQGERLVVCAMQDVSDRQRLAVLMQMFFHDVLNTAGCIHGFAEYLHSSPTAATPEADLLDQMAQMTGQLLEEIRAQRDLVAAESGELIVCPAPLATRDLLEDLRALYSRHAVAAGRTIRCAEIWDGLLVTDRQLLARVLGNMIKNALEATPPGGTVSLGCAGREGQVVFSVHNASVMPPEVQLQVFQRSFSTKLEVGHGIGTYSIRLIGERYLRGQVAFCSRAPEGTIFTITLPKRLEQGAGSGEG